MRIEDLISKYLDSDLMPDEDIVLREMLANDPSAKSAFNAAVDVDHLIREDACKIEVPEDLSSDVEDQVMMMILSDSADVPSKKEVPSPKSRRKVLNIRPILALFIALALSLNFVGLDELGIGNDDLSNALEFYDENFNATGDIQSASDKININKKINKKINKNINTNISSEKSLKNNFDNKFVNKITEIAFSQAHKQTVKIEKKSNLTFEDIKAVSSVLGELNVREENSDNSNNSNNNYDSYDGYLANENLNITKTSPAVEPFISNPLGGMGLNSFANNGFANNLETNPAFAMPILRANFTQNEFDFNNLRFIGLAQTDFATKGISPTENRLISSVSQKILYKTSEKSFFGVEFGYSEYSVTGEKDIVIPYYEIESGNYQGNIQGEKTNFGIKSNMEMQEVYSAFFAAVIYQRNLVKKSVFELNAGAGLGASADGLLGKVMLIGSVELFSGIRFTAGIETKMMSINLSRYKNHNDELRAAGSFIYGLDFNF